MAKKQRSIQLPEDVWEVANELAYGHGCSVNIVIQVGLTLALRTRTDGVRDLVIAAIRENRATKRERCDG